MTPDRTIDIISALLAGHWLDSEAAALQTLQTLGYAQRHGTPETSASGLQQRQLEPLSGDEEVSMSLSLFDGMPFSVGFFPASSPGPADAKTLDAYEELVASMVEILGAPERFWSDKPTPVRWQAPDLDVGAQLFDRRDSSVMFWVEHRSRSERAEQDALAAKPAS